MDKEQKQTMAVIIISAVLLAVAVACERLLTLPIWGYLLIYLIPYFICGFETLKETAENIIHGEIFDECFLMTVATVGALAIGFIPDCENEFAEAVFVMLFFRLGELLESIAEGKSQRSIQHLTQIKSEIARIKTIDGEKEVSPEDVSIGDTLVIRAGEKIPLDGVVTSGASTVSTLALTGESLPRDVREGDEVLSGFINISGVIEVKVTTAYGADTASKIIQLIKDAAETKSDREGFITRFAKIYTPVVVFAALAISFIPPLFYAGYMTGLMEWLPKGLTFLVVSCPCALVISVPLSYFCGIGAASKAGILIKGGKYIDALAALDTVVFDKTGTLTSGSFSVTAVHPESISEHELLHIASHAESFSNHPIARSVVDGYGTECRVCKVSNLNEIAGKGVTAEISGAFVAVGNDDLMQDNGVAHGSCHHSGTVVHISVDGKYAGHIAVSDTVKPDSPKAVAELKRCGINKTVMLTGDASDTAEEIAHALGIDECHGKLLPADKLSIATQLKAGLSKGRTLAFVGDGINDAPVLAGADVGIAMGALGSDAAIEAADVVLMDDSPLSVARAVGLSRRTLRVVNQNVYFSILCKLAVLALTAAGFSNMFLAVFADVGVTLICILNALRVSNFKYLY